MKSDQIKRYCQTKFKSGCNIDDTMHADYENLQIDDSAAAGVLDVSQAG